MFFGNFEQNMKMFVFDTWDRFSCWFFGSTSPFMNNLGRIGLLLRSYDVDFPGGYPPPWVPTIWKYSLNRDVLFATQADYHHQALPNTLQEIPLQSVIFTQAAYIDSTCNTWIFRFSGLKLWLIKGFHYQYFPWLESDMELLRPVT